MSIAEIDFVENVRAFCKWLESDSHDCLSARQLLLGLMQGIPHLTVQGQSEDQLQDYPRRGYDGWKIDFGRLVDLPLHHYRMIYSPGKIEEDESVVNDLRDDLADIYGDLWHGLAALNDGNAAYAIQYWRNSYFFHWGHHAAAAVYALDEYFRESENGEQDAAPNGGPTAAIDNPNASGRPPSVS